MKNVKDRVNNHLLSGRQHSSSAWKDKQEVVLRVLYRSQLISADFCEQLHLLTQLHAKMQLPRQDFHNQSIASLQFLYYLEALLYRLSQTLPAQEYFSHWSCQLQFVILSMQTFSAVQMQFDGHLHLRIDSINKSTRLWWKFYVEKSSNTNWRRDGKT